MKFGLDQVALHLKPMPGKLAYSGVRWPCTAPMSKRMIRLGLVLMLASACNLRTTSPAAVSLSPAQTRPIESTGCIVDTAGILYVVQAGDNLTNIALTFGSTINAIATANCLANPNRLDRGQRLYIPDSVPGESPCPVSDSVGTNFVTIVPSTNLGSRCLQVRSNMTVNIMWPNPPADLIEVTFYRASAQLLRPDVIGVDRTLDDGFSVQWRTIVGTPPSLIYAVGEDGRQSDPIGVVVH